MSIRNEAAVPTVIFRKRQRLIWISVLFILIPFSSMLFAQGDQKPDSMTTTKILLIGCLHHEHLIQADYGPQHVRALIAKFHPDVLGVENPAVWHRDEKLFFPFLVELHVAMKWGKEHDIPVYGIDFQEMALAQEEPETSESKVKKAGERAWTPLSRGLVSGDVKIKDQIKKAGDRNAQHQASIVYTDIRQDALYFHTSDLARGMKLFEAWPPERKKRIELRDEKIADNILSVAGTHPGKRMAVVIGNGHLPGLEKWLSGQEEIQLIDILELLPLSRHELESHISLTDIYWILARHLDGVDIDWIPQKLDWRRAQNLLEKAQHEAPDSPVTQYFQARWAWQMGDIQSAEKEFERLTKLEEDLKFPFPINSIWLWPPLANIQLKARFTLANIYDYLGQREKAISLYKELLANGDALNTHGHQAALTLYDVEKYIESFLEEPYCRYRGEFVRPKRYLYEQSLDELQAIPWRW